MLKNNIIRDRKGYSLIELLVVMTMIGILAIIGVPRYADFVAKGNVRRAANDLLQNARIASTLAIKENRNYVIAFYIAGANSYSIGFDTNDDGIPEGYDNGPVRVVNLQTAYGSNIGFGTLATNVPDYQQPNQCPACSAVAGSVFFDGNTGVVREIFNPDGSVAFIGHVVINHTVRGYSYILRFRYLSGKLDLWMWDGDIDNQSPDEPVECINPPLKYCGWTEIR
jgi:prepilin-type N-terminal cleavage/methylation domain-containing protein